MNRIFKNGYAVALATLALAFTACTDEYEYDPASPDTGSAGAYISADETTLIFTEKSNYEDEGEVPMLTFTVNRHDTDEAKTYRLYSSDESVQIPSEVSFAAGEQSKTFTVNIDITPGTIEKKIVIGVEDDDAYMYGAHSLTFNVSLCKRVYHLDESTNIEDVPAFYTQFYGNQLTGTGSYWGAVLYEYGKTTSERVGDDGKTVITTTKSTFYLKDPYNVEVTDENGNPLYNEDGTPQTLMGENALGYGLTFTITSSSVSSESTCRAELGDAPTLFYADVSITQDPSVVGVVTPSGNGTYYPTGQTVRLDSNLESVDNVAVFSWMMLIGDTGAGFNSMTHAIIFPDGYDPRTQEWEDDTNNEQ